MKSLREMAGSTSGGSKGGVMPVDSGDSNIEVVYSSSSEISSEMAIKIFCSLHL
jgi:hypothetical protein